MNKALNVHVKNSYAGGLPEILQAHKQVKKMRKPKPKSWMELAFVPKIFVHEEVDMKRVGPLSKLIQLDQTQKNPIIAVKGPKGELVHLDGANRVAALKKLDCIYILTQVIDHKQENTIELGTWFHLNKISYSKLMEFYGDSLVKVASEQALEMLENEQTSLAFWFSNTKVYVMDTEMALSSIIKDWENITELYQAKTERKKINTDFPSQEISGWLDDSDEHNVCVAFAPITVDNVIEITCNMNKKIPAGITRIKVLCGRDMGVNFPLALLQTCLGAKESAKMLKDYLRSMSVRRYGEKINIYEKQK